MYEIIDNIDTGITVAESKEEAIEICNDMVACYLKYGVKTYSRFDNETGLFYIEKE